MRAFSGVERPALRFTVVIICLTLAALATARPLVRRHHPVTNHPQARSPRLSIRQTALDITEANPEQSIVTVARESKPIECVAEPRLPVLPIISVPRELSAGRCATKLVLHRKLARSTSGGDPDPLV